MCSLTFAFYHTSLVFFFFFLCCCLRCRHERCGVWRKAQLHGKDRRSRRRTAFAFAGVTSHHHCVCACLALAVPLALSQLLLPPCWRCQPISTACLVSCVSGVVIPACLSLATGTCLVIHAQSSRLLLVEDAPPPGHAARSSRANNATGTPPRHGAQDTSSTTGSRGRHTRRHVLEERG